MFIQLRGLLTEYSFYPSGVLVTDGAVSTFLEKVIEELDFVKVSRYINIRSF